MNSSWEFGVCAAILIFLARNYKSTIFYAKMSYYYGIVTIVTSALLPYFVLFKPRNVSNLL